LSAANSLDEDRGRAAAEAGLEHARSRLARLIPGDVGLSQQIPAVVGDPWHSAALVLVDTARLGDERYHVSIRDAGASVNLNLATEEELERLFVALPIDAGRATEIESLYADALERESKTGTGVPGGLAIPHCRSTAVTQPTLAFARLSVPVDFGAKDAQADLVFFIAAPEGADQEHLKLLAKLARSLMKKDFVASLRAAGSASEIVDLVAGVVAPAPVAVSAEGRITPDTPLEGPRAQEGRPLAVQLVHAGARGGV